MRSEEARQAPVRGYFRETSCDSMPFAQPVLAILSVIIRCRERQRREGGSQIIGERICFEKSEEHLSLVLRRVHASFERKKEVKEA